MGGRAKCRTVRSSSRKCLDHILSNPSTQTLMFPGRTSLLFLCSMLCEIEQRSCRHRSPWVYFYDPPSGTHYSSWGWVALYLYLHLTPDLLESWLWSHNSAPPVSPKSHDVMLENQVIWTWNVTIFIWPTDYLRTKWTFLSDGLKVPAKNWNTLVLKFFLESFPEKLTHHV